MGSHLFERKQKVLATHTTLITCHGARNYHHSNHTLEFQRSPKRKEMTHCQEQVDLLAPITTLSRRRLGKLRRVLQVNRKKGK